METNDNNRISVMYTQDRAGNAKQYLFCPAAKADEVFNDFMSHVVRTVEDKANRYAIQPGSLIFLKYDNIPPHTFFLKNGKLNFFEFSDYVKANLIQPSDYRDLNDMIVQYDRGNRDLYRTSIDDRACVTAAETGKGVLLFGDSLNEQDELKHYLKYLGDHFFDRETDGVKHLNLYRVATYNPKLLTKAEWDYPEIVPDPQKPGYLKFNRTYFENCTYFDKQVLTEHPFKRHLSYDFAPDYKKCTLFHTDFGVPMCDRVKAIVNLNEVNKQGADISPETMDFLGERYPELFQIILRQRKDKNSIPPVGRSFHPQFDYDLKEFGKQMLERDFGDRRQPKELVKKACKRLGL